MRKRVQIGFLEEYFDESGYLGSLHVQTTTQGTGSNNMVEIVLEADLEIKRSFSKMRTLKKGQKVRRMVSPLEGRAID